MVGPNGGTFLVEVDTRAGAGRRGAEAVVEVEFSAVAASAPTIMVSVVVA